MRRSLFSLALAVSLGDHAEAQTLPQSVPLPPPGQLVDIGGYRVHLWCTGSSSAGRPTVVLSAGGGDFAVDWSRVQRPLSDSVRVCSYDRPGYGWSDPGPYPRTIRQEAFELSRALEVASVKPPFVLVGHSIGTFVVRAFADAHAAHVVGMVLVGSPTENGKLGYRGQFVIPRTLASDRPVPSPRRLAESPPQPIPGAEGDSCRVRAERSARIYRPYDQLFAQAQRYRIWALQHPSCISYQDDFFAEEMAGFFNSWTKSAHPLGDLPLIVILGTQRSPPPGMSLTEWRSDSLRLDLSRLSSRGRAIADSLSGHHTQLDNPNLVIGSIMEVVRAGLDAKRGPP